MTDMSAAENVGYEIALALTGVAREDLHQASMDLMNALCVSWMLTPEEAAITTHTALYTLADLVLQFRPPFDPDEIANLREQLLLGFLDRQMENTDEGEKA